MSPRLLALIGQGFLQINERKKTYKLLSPISLWLVDRAIRDALGAEMRAVYGEMMALGYQFT